MSNGGKQKHIEAKDAYLLQQIANEEAKILERDLLLEETLAQKKAYKQLKYQWRGGSKENIEHIKLNEASNTLPMVMDYPFPDASMEC